MGNVYEYLFDGASGLAPAGVDGAAMVAGVCSLGVVGRGYLLGPRSDIEGTLGSGPLADRVRDIFATAGQKAKVIAVPVAGSASSYFTPVANTGDGPLPTMTGVASANADVAVKISTAGAPGVAQAQISLDGGETYGTETAIPANGQLVTGSGITLTFEGTLALNDVYSFLARTAIGPVAKTGTGPDVTVTGTVKAAADLRVMVTEPGDLNEGQFKLSSDGGDNYGLPQTIPEDGTLELADLGVTITFAAGDYVAGTLYSCTLLEPQASIASVMTAIEQPLALYDVEFIYVCGASDSVAWAACQAKADELFAAHRPTYFKCEARLPYEGESLDEWVAALLTEKLGLAARFVQVCAQFGEVSDSSGYKHVRNWGGLQAGRTLGNPVQRAAGRVKDGPINPGSLPAEWSEAVQSTLESAGYLTAKNYAGLSGCYWGDSRTLASATSDYQYEEVVRVVFKAVRLERIAALASMYDELGDPVVEATPSGIAMMKASIENALGTMTSAIPREMAGYVVEVPAGQDYVNNGIAVETTLIGIPIIRQIKLYSRYVYAGSRFDPRLE